MHYTCFDQRKRANAAFLIGAYAVSTCGAGSLQWGAGAVLGPGPSVPGLGAGEGTVGILGSLGADRMERVALVPMGSSLLGFIFIADGRISEPRCEAGIPGLCRC